MHDAYHAQKVAHLMWHILKPEKRERLTPPEIGLMVLSAYFHDLGMALSADTRKDRLSAMTQLIQRNGLTESHNLALVKLKQALDEMNPSSANSERIRIRLHQAEEALLCIDTRSRHATRERYNELLADLSSYHEQDPARIPDIHSSITFEGDSLLPKLIEICVSHGAEADYLLQTDRTGSGRPMFPRNYPLGSCEADLQMVAASLRLADILDFDRERTPAVLLHFLLPDAFDMTSDSAVEWSKHLSISNWYIERDAIVFRGHCNSHIVHHSIVKFCNTISEEISSTKTIFGALTSTDWPFALPTYVKPDIHEQGYRYVPYRLELDDERIYRLLMGGAIYQNPLDALRELLQNAVDACKLRDSITKLNDPHLVPSPEDRITVRFEEAVDPLFDAKLIVEDTGTGMDALVIERFFLKVGRSYYNSSEFLETRRKLRESALDFAPVSEFGIGFVSSFLLADQVKVETAMWESMHGGDLSKRTLWIDGPTRLIRLEEEKNQGPTRFKGTRITLTISSRFRTRDSRNSITWSNIVNYLKNVCQDLPYTILLEHVASNNLLDRLRIKSIPMRVELPEYLSTCAIRIPVDDEESTLEGEIVLIDPLSAAEAEETLVRKSPVSEEPLVQLEGISSSLVRGGFSLGAVPGLPETFVATAVGRARLRYNWRRSLTLRYPQPSIARDRIADLGTTAKHVVRLWLTHLLNHIDTLPHGLLYYLSLRHRGMVKECLWLQQHNAFDLYRLARRGWCLLLQRKDSEANPLDQWEKSTGDPIWLGSSFRENLYWQLLDIVLPRVTSLLMGPQAVFYVHPPSVAWQDTLREWNTFIESPVDWGPFVEYRGSIERLLYYEYPGSSQLNSLYRDRICNAFREEEIIPLSGVLARLADSRAYRIRQVLLTKQQRTLFATALQALGELEIGSVHGSWRIDDFAGEQKTD
jgi:hypothetical protein